MPGVTTEVRVEGVREVVLGFEKLAAEARIEVKVWLKDTAKQVAEVAKEKAREQGFEAPGRSGRGTGDLVRKIKPSLVRGTEARIREGAARNGYSYPSVYEFGRGGVRAFMYPAADESREFVIESFDRLAAHIVESF